MILTMDIGNTNIKTASIHAAGSGRVTSPIPSFIIFLPGFCFAYSAVFTATVWNR